MELFPFTLISARNPHLHHTTSCSPKLLCQTHPGRTPSSGLSIQAHELPHTPEEEWSEATWILSPPPNVRMSPHCCAADQDVPPKCGAAGPAEEQGPARKEGERTVHPSLLAPLSATPWGPHLPRGVLKTDHFTVACLLETGCTGLCSCQPRPPGCTNSGSCGGEREGAGLTLRVHFFLYRVYFLPILGSLGSQK